LSLRRAVFLDRDGVINQYRPDYVRVESDFEFVPDAEDAFRVLGRLRAPLVVVTNQSAIGRGTTTAAVVEAIHDRLMNQARAWGAPLASIEVCPHAPEDRCSCRKPRLGLFRRAEERLGLSLPGSFLIGDAPTDIESAAALGVRAVRVRTGRGAEPLRDSVVADAVVDDFLGAARWIASRWEEPKELSANRRKGR